MVQGPRYIAPAVLAIVTALLDPYINIFLEWLPTHQKPRKPSLSFTEKYRSMSLVSNDATQKFS